VVGQGEDRDIPNADEPGHLYTGITVVAERAHIPVGTRIGRNCLIGPSVTESDFPVQLVPSGTSVLHDAASAPTTSPMEG